MQEYDVALKLLLQGSAKLTIREVAGGPVEKWLDIELPKVQNLRMDLLGETAGGGLVHVELQSGNDAAMPLRMAEYCLGVFRLFGKFPRQVLLYVGEPPLRMESELRGPDVWFRYRVIDIRELDGDRLIESGEVGDNVIAILARLRDHREAVRKIVGKIASLAAAEREAALGRLLILAGLRRLEETVAREIQRMPVYIDILENKVLGPPYKKGLEEGRQEGLEEGRQEGMQEGERKGELAVLRRLIEKRFGAIPSWAEERLAGRSTVELVDLSVRVLDAQSMEDLLR
jgi:predicted transposase YdaD